MRTRGNPFGILQKTRKKKIKIPTAVLLIIIIIGGRLFFLQHIFISGLKDGHHLVDNSCKINENRRNLATVIAILNNSWNHHHIVIVILKEENMPTTEISCKHLPRNHKSNKSWNNNQKSTKNKIPANRKKEGKDKRKEKESTKDHYK